MHSTPEGSKAPPLRTTVACTAQPFGLVFPPPFQPRLAGRRQGRGTLPSFRQNPEEERIFGPRQNILRELGPRLLQIMIASEGDPAVLRRRLALRLYNGGGRPVDFVQRGDDAYQQNRDQQ